MGNFFGSIYCWFEDFFGIPLADYLWGVSSSVSTNNQYIGIGLWMLAISLIVAVIYYYVIDKPRFATWWGWGIFLGVNAVINFFVGWQLVLKDYYDGLMVQKNPATNVTMPLNISESDILCFGVANMIISLMAFFVISMIIKWWSNNCKHAPF